MLKRIASLFQRHANRPPYTGELVLTHVGDPEAPGYPPPPNGIPLVEPETLLRRHEDLLAGIRQSVGIADPIFETLYVPALRRLAEFLHLLPASESHHHRGAGGALRHAIEVAAYTTKASESVMIGSIDLPVKRKQKEVAWRYAAFLAGLCHDIGKPVTDMTVHSDRGRQWNPMTEGLFSWGKNHQASCYYISWQPGRHRLHEQFYSLMVSRIAGTEGMEYLGSIGPDAVGWILSLAQAATIEQKKMYELVIKGDALSVENDLRTHAGGASVAIAGVNLEKVVRDVIHNRLRLEIWAVNRPGGRVWKTASGVFLVWPIAGEEILEDLSPMRRLGLPKSQEELLAFLLERGLAVRMGESGEDSGLPLWKLKIPTANGLVAVLTAVKLSEDSGVPAMLSSVPSLPDEPDVARNGAPHEAHEQTDQAAVSIQKQPAADGRTPDAPGGCALFPSREEMGPHGVILEAMRDDMLSGRLKPGEDYILKDGRMAIAYPDGLDRTGVEPNSILEWLEQNRMLETDPYQSGKSVHELDGFNPPRRARKAIVLTREATAHFGFDAVSTTSQAAGQSAAVTSAEDIPEIIRRYVEELKQGKTGMNTPFLIQETEQGWYVPRQASISWFVKRCGDKSARNELLEKLQTNQPIREVEKDRKRMLFVPREIL